MTKSTSSGSLRAMALADSTASLIPEKLELPGLTVATVLADSMVSQSRQHTDPCVETDGVGGQHGKPSNG